MKRAEVGDLQAALAGLGYDIGGREAARRRLGAGTRRAVMLFQKAQGLDPTGEVDQRTAEALAREWDRLRSSQGGTETSAERETVQRGGEQSLAGGVAGAMDLDRGGEDLKSRAVTGAAVTLESQGDAVSEAVDESQFLVRGRVVQPDLSPEAGVTVRALDKDMRLESDLGSATTRADGTYVIRYTRARFSRPDKSRADLIVRAYDRSGNEVAASSLICSAGAEELVDLVVGNQPLREQSEYERLVGTIRPYLRDISVANLERDDVEFLVCGAEVDQLQLATLVVASRLATATSLPDWFFYALGRQALRLQLEALVMLSRRDLRNALEVAIDAAIVPAPSTVEVDRLLDQLQAVLIRTAFDDSGGDSRGFAMGALLGTSLVDRELQEAFLARYLARSDSPEEFWNGLEQDDRFSGEAINDLRLTLALGRLTRYRLPVLEQLKRLRENGELRSLRDLARLDRARWRDMLRAAGRAGGADLPEDVPGETAEDRLEHYITSLRAPIEHLFPGDSLRRALNAAPDAEPNVVRLLSNAEDLDLYWTNIDVYLEAHRDDALAGIPAAQQEGVIAQVKRLQRLLRVSPRADHVRVLDAAGFDSAVAIARTPRRRFRARFVESAERIKDTLDDAYEVTATSTDEIGGESRSTILMMMNSAASPTAVADKIQTSAVTATSMYVQQYVKLATGFQRWSGAIGAPEDPQSEVEGESEKEIADLETLFGSQSFCECEHCRSVYSPAAYLVDLLHELDDLSSNNGTLMYEDPADVPGPIGVLMKRRPDVANTPLTCQNTNTPVPYIDLVNEALESYVESHLDSAGEWLVNAPTSTPTIKAYDTGTATAYELRGVPQNVIPEVYEHLARKAVYPMTLPFHRPLEVARAYLAHLGTSRAEVMEVFRTAGTPSSLALVVERLGVSPAQYQIIAATSSTDPTFDATDGPQDIWTYYGFASEVELTELAHVPEMLRRTGLAFGDLVAVLKTRFLNPQLYSTSPTNVVQIQFPTSLAADACDTSIMELTELGPNGDPASGQSWLDSLQRFVRLWRALGWRIADVDCAVTAVGGTLDDTALDKLASVKELADALGQPVGVLPGLWGPLDTWGEESRYDQVFLNRAVLQDPSQWKAFEDARSSTSVKKLNDLLPTLAAALAVTEDDIGRIRTHAGQTGDLPLDLDNLTLLYRYATLAAALRLRVRDLVTLLHLIPASMNPFTAGDPRPSVEFVRIVRSVEASGFSIPLLNYLFRDEAEPTRHPAPTRALVASTLSALQDGLAAIHQETRAGEQPPAEALRAGLEVAAGPALLSLEVPEDVDRALAILDPRQTTFQGQNLTTDIRESFVTDHFATFLPNPAVVLFGTPLPTPENASDAEQRFLENVGMVLDALLPWLRRNLQEALVVDTMAAAMGVDQELMRRLIESLAGPPPSGTVLDFLLGLVDPAGAPTDLHLDEDPPKPPTAMFHRVFKAAALASGFGMTEAELALLTGTSSPLLTFDLNAPLSLDLDELPVSGAEPAPSMQPGQLFDVWRALRAYYELREGLPRSEKTLVDYFTADAGDKLKTLEEVTGWGQAQIGAVIQGFGAPTDTLPWLIRLQRAMSLLTRVGATPERIFAWASKPPSHSDADEVVQTVKAHYEGAQWLEVARGINDPLREKQRDALVALLIPRLQGAAFPIETPNDLFDYFLIDIEMNSCMLTSRIKQAISSVQLFVQRCRLNLEPGVSPDEIEPGRWEWLKHYRIWEANRKVFLYPENWIEPELRDDRTPFFRDLETELLQNELTEETIEHALATYLYRLDEVARLDIRAFCKQDDAGRETYHVFGRTWNQPYVYYYRSGAFATDSGDGQWTPWERVDLDIPSDRIIPAIANGRLLVFWPLFDQKPDQDNRSRSTFHIRLAYGALEGGRWRKKGTSAEAVVIRWRSFDESDPPATGVFGDARALSAPYMLFITPDSEPLGIRVGYYDPTNSYYYTGALDGAFSMNQCGRGQISARQITVGSAWAVGPWGAGVESQQFVSMADDLQTTPFFPKRILDNVPTGFVAVLPSPEPVDIEAPYSFFFQDGPPGSQTYFVRPVVETQGPLLDPHSKSATGGGVLEVAPIVDTPPFDKSWGPDPIMAFAFVGVNVNVPGGVTGWLAPGME